MEKKQNRTGQAPIKGAGTDTKKSQDVANGKHWPRGSRKREPTGVSFTPKNEPNRKPTPQRNKTYDKRPKPRGNYYAESACGKESPGLAELDSELGSVFNPGSKKQSMNHLLNFHYTLRGDQRNYAGPVSKSGSGSHRFLSTSKHKYNKEEFLQANCQFVVNSEGDYKLYMNNPDALVDWDLVEQIHVQVSEFPSCPICLYQPCAAKMTRCGHVYCWSCILHYLALSEKTWSKCPICHEAVHKNDLKSVVAMPHAAFNVGKYINLRLMKRAQGSLTAFPVDEAKISRQTLLNISETKVNTVYSKLLLANSTEVLSIINRERNELHAQISDEENCAETCFIEQAILHLQNREKNLLEKLHSSNNSASSIKPVSKKTNNNLQLGQPNEQDFGTGLLSPNNNLSENRTRFESVSSEGIESEDFNFPGHDELVFAVENTNIPSTSDNNNDNIKYYYFYQASDGQHIYLHAVNIRMLEHTYGSLEFCPPTINGRIIEKEGGSMTEDLRRRLRCLQHLPLTCQFEVAEIQLRPPVISKETLDFFQDQLETRKKRRQRQQRDEKRREKRIEVEENRRMGIASLPETNVHIESFQQFPVFGADDPALGSSPPARLSDMGFVEYSSSSSCTGSVPAEELCSGPSFAKMLVSGKSKPVSWPGLHSSSQRMISVTPSQQPHAPPVTRPHRSDSESDPEGYVPAPAFNQSFSDAIALALEKANIADKNADGVACSSGGKKKKKNKQKVLFATSMVYSGKE